LLENFKRPVDIPVTPTVSYTERPRIQTAINHRNARSSGHTATVPH
jgi:hypothetical protein